MPGTVLAQRKVRAGGARVGRGGCVIGVNDIVGVAVSAEVVGE